MKILLANASAYPTIGGVENSLRFMGKELLQLGHEVKIWSFQNDPQLSLREVYENIEIIRIPIKFFRLPDKRNRMKVEVTKNGIKEFIEEYKPDAIWSRTASIGLGIAQSGYKGPLFQIFCTNAYMDACGTFLFTKGLSIRRRLLRLSLFLLHFSSLYTIEKKLLKVCTPIYFSENMHVQMEHLYHKIEKKQYVIYPGVDKDVFNNAHGESFREEILTKYNIPYGKKIILYVGRLSVGKNIYFLIDSFMLLKSDSILLLVGSGGEIDRIRKYVNSKGLTNKVYFAGLQDRLLPGFYTIADVTVLPTTIESFGQVYLESLACGTPAVGFKGDNRKVLTATDEIIKDGVTGCVVKSVTISDFAEGIDRIIRLPEIEYQKMSEDAIKDIAKRFSWLSFVNTMLELSKIH